MTLTPPGATAVQPGPSLEHYDAPAQGIASAAEPSPIGLADLEPLPTCQETHKHRKRIAICCMPGKMQESNATCERGIVVRTCT